MSVSTHADGALDQDDRSGIFGSPAAMPISRSSRHRPLQAAREDSREQGEVADCIMTEAGAPSSCYNRESVSAFISRSAALNHVCSQG
jgi:hypothetical protein